MSVSSSISSSNSCPRACARTSSPERRNCYSIRRDIGLLRIAELAVDWWHALRESFCSSSSWLLPVLIFASNVVFYLPLMGDRSVSATWSVHSGADATVTPVATPTEVESSIAPWSLLLRVPPLFPNGITRVRSAGPVSIVGIKIGFVRLSSGLTF